VPVNLLQSPKSRYFFSPLLPAPLFFHFDIRYSIFLVRYSIFLPSSTFEFWSFEFVLDFGFLTSHLLIHAFTHSRVTSHERRATHALRARIRASRLFEKCQKVHILVNFLQISVNFCQFLSIFDPLFRTTCTSYAKFRGFVPDNHPRFYPKISDCALKCPHIIPIFTTGACVFASNHP